MSNITYYLLPSSNGWSARIACLLIPKQTGGDGEERVLSEKKSARAA